MLLHASFPLFDMKHDHIPKKLNIWPFDPNQGLRVCVRTEYLLFFSTNGEVSYKSIKYVWAYNETQIDLGVSPTVWSGFTLLMTTSESASLIIFRYLEYFKNPWFVDSSSNQFDWTWWAFKLTDCVFLWYSLKVDMLLNHLHLGWNQVGTAWSHW